MERWREQLYLEHSAKGRAWDKHKYIAINNGRYIYPEDTKKAKKPVYKIQPVVPKDPDYKIQPVVPVNRILPVEPKDPIYKISPYVPEKKQPGKKKEEIEKKVKRVRKLKLKYLRQRSR